MLLERRSRQVCLWAVARRRGAATEAVRPQLFGVQPRVNPFISSIIGPHGGCALATPWTCSRATRALAKRQSRHAGTTRAHRGSRALRPLAITVRAVFPLLHACATHLLRAH